MVHCSKCNKKNVDYCSININVNPVWTTGQYAPIGFGDSIVNITLECHGVRANYRCLVENYISYSSKDLDFMNLPANWELVSFKVIPKITNSQKDDCFPHTCEKCGGKCYKSLFNVEHESGKCVSKLNS